MRIAVRLHRKYVPCLCHDQSTFAELQRTHFLSVVVSTSSHRCWWSRVVYIKKKKQNRKWHLASDTWITQKGRVQGDLENKTNLSETFLLNHSSLWKALNSEDYFWACVQVCYTVTSMLVWWLMCLGLWSSLLCLSTKCFYRWHRHQTKSKDSEWKQSLITRTSFITGSR